MELEALTIAINRINSAIKSEDRRKRKATLGELEQFLNASKVEESQHAFECFQPTLVRSLNDSAEAVRTAAVQILIDAIPKFPQNNKLLEDVIPTLTYRLTDPDVREHSEELRLQFIELLTIIIQTYHENIAVYTEDIVNILCQTLQDSYPKLKQESAKCCSVLAKNVTQQMYNHGYKLVKPILANFKQTHFRTRLLAIEALCEVLREGNWKFLEAQEVFGSLGELLFDSNFSVRLAVVDILGDWFLRLVERYSFFARMIPLMLSSLDDSQPEVSERARLVWSAAGKQYTAENEQDLKDKIDFLDGKPLHYPDDVERPNLGCRTLVQRHTLQIMKPLLSELDDWKIEIRIKGSYLLVRLILHAEQDITQHTEYILKSMYLLAEKEDPAILVENVEQAAEFMAYFVDADTWYQLIFPTLQDGVRLGHLRILSAFCRGTRFGDLTEFLEPLCAVLKDKTVCTTREALYQTQILKCCYAILGNVPTIEGKAREDVYFAITYVCAIAGESEDIVKAGKAVLQILAEKSLSSVEVLSAGYILSVVEDLTNSVEGWTSVSPELALLVFILKQPASVWIDSVDAISEILQSALKIDRDATMRSRLFILLAQVLTNERENLSVAAPIYAKFLLTVIKNMICPNLIWRAGKTSEAVRTTTVACLHEVLDFITILDGLPAEEIAKILLPPLIDCLRDTASDTRLIAMKSITGVIVLASKNSVFAAEHVNSIYSEVLGRLDDVSDEVRSEAVDCLSAIYKHLPESYNESGYRYPFENVVHIMLTHLDDPDVKFQHLILGALKTVGGRAPNVVREKLASRRHLLKAQDCCDQLQQHIDSL